MKLDSSVAKFFNFSVYLGMISVFFPMFIAMIDGSPYHYGRPGMSWMLLQMGSSAMLLYAGMFGLMTYNVTEISAQRFNMKVAWGSFLVVDILFISSVWLCFSPLFPITSKGDWTDVAVAWIVTITAVLAVVTFIQACRYFLRLHRLRSPYVEVLRQMEEGD